MSNSEEGLGMGPVGALSFRRKLVGVLDILFLFGAMAQLVIAPSIDTLAGVMTLGAGWFIVSRVSVVTTDFERSALSSSALLLFGVFGLLLPVCLTALEGVSIANNLRTPKTTVAAQFGVAAIYCLALQSSRILNLREDSGLRGVLSHFGYYRQLSASILWVLGLLGFLGMFYLYFVIGYWSTDYGARGVDYIIANWLSSFVWMPMLILFRKFISRSGSFSALESPGLVIVYTIVVAFVAVATNWRTLVYSGVMFAVLITILGLLAGQISFRRTFTFGRVMAGCVLSLLILPFVSDLGIAMVMVRDSRQDLDPGTLISKTFDNLMDREGLEAFKVALDSGKTRGRSPAYEWDEFYLSNPIFGRFVTLKVADNSLYYMDAIGPMNPLMIEDYERQLMAIFPSFVSSDYFVSGDERDEVTKHSPGDVLFSTFLGKEAGIGSMLVSHPIGVGLAYFGWYMPIVLFIVFVLFFTLADLLFRYERGQMFFGAPMGSLLIPCFTMLADRHCYVMEVKFIARTFWEVGLMSCALVFFLRFLGRALSDGRGSAQV